MARCSPCSASPTCCASTSRTNWSTTTVPRRSTTPTRCAVRRCSRCAPWHLLTARLARTTARSSAGCTRPSAASTSPTSTSSPSCSSRRRERPGACARACAAATGAGAHAAAAATQQPHSLLVLRRRLLLPLPPARHQDQPALRQDEGKVQAAQLSDCTVFVPPCDRLRASGAMLAAEQREPGRSTGEGGEVASDDFPLQLFQEVRDVRCASARARPERCRRPRPAHAARIAAS